MSFDSFNTPQRHRGDDGLPTAAEVEERLDAIEAVVPVGGAPLVDETSAQTLTNKDLSDCSNNVTARTLCIDNGASTVSVFAAAPPAVGQVLKATSATTATWQGDAAGEANTSSSAGGTSLVLPKVGVDLPFKGLTATSTKIGLTANAADVGIDVNEANLTLNNLGGTLSETKGGTGQITYATGDLLYASAANTLSKLAAVAAGSVLKSAGVATAPVYGAVDLTADVTGTLPVANGGTGSATQNFVDLTTAQSVGGNKTFTGTTQLDDVLLGDTSIELNGFSSLTVQRSNAGKTQLTVISNGANDADFRMQRGPDATSLFEISNKAGSVQQSVASGVGSLIFNATNEDCDFRVDGTTDSALYVDAGNNNVSVAKGSAAAAGYGLEVGDTIYSNTTTSNDNLELVKSNSTTSWLINAGRTAFFDNWLLWKNSGEAGSFTLALTNTGSLRGKDATAGSPTYGFVNASNYGMSYEPTASRKGVILSTAGTPRINVRDTGSIVMGSIVAYGGDASAIVEHRSTTKGYLPPRMTVAQRDAIATPAAGLTVYNNQDDELNVYDGSAWTSTAATGRAAMYVSTPAATTIGVAGTYVKAAGTTTVESNAKNWSMPANNRLRYDGIATKDAHVDFAVTSTCASNNQTIGFRVAKNGTTIASSTIQRRIGTGTDQGSINVHAYTSVATNDYLELWITNETSTASPTVEKMYAFVHDF